MAVKWVLETLLSLLLRRVKVLRIKIKEENKLKKFKSLWEGLTFPSKSFGDFTITEYVNSKHVVVQFVNTHNKVKTVKKKNKIN